MDELLFHSCTCPICGEGTDAEYIAYHVGLHECAKCGDHHHEEAPCNPNIRFLMRCPLCPTVSYGGNDFISHMEEHKCSECGFIMCTCKVIEQQGKRMRKYWEREVTLARQEQENRQVDDEQPGPSSAIREPYTRSTEPGNNYDSPNESYKRMRFAAATGEEFYTDPNAICIDCNQTDCICQQLSPYGMEEFTPLNGPMTLEKTVLEGLRTGVCPFCAVSFDGREKTHDVFAHIITSHQHQWGGGAINDNRVINPIQLHLTRKIFEDVYRVYELDLQDINIVDINALFHAIWDQFRQIVADNFSKIRNCRLQFHMKCHMFKEDGNGMTTHAYPNMESFNFVVENSEYAMAAFNMARDNFQVRIEDFIENGSNWRLDKITEFQIIFSKCNLLSGGLNLELPDILRHKSYNFVNVPSNDGMCFVRCIIAKLFHDELKVYDSKKGQWKPDNNKRRFLEQNQFYDDRMSRHSLNLKGITYPMDLKQIYQFERQNPLIGVNVFVFDQEMSDEFDQRSSQRKRKTRSEQVENYHRLRSSLLTYKLAHEQRPIIVDMLLYIDGDHGHFLWIQNLKGLLRHPSKNNQDIVCHHCLTLVGRERSAVHADICPMLGKMLTIYPEDDERLLFNQWSKCIPHPFVAAADFECRLKRMDETHGSMQKIRKHIPTGYAWCVADDQRNIVDYNIRVARNEEEDVAYSMLSELLTQADIVAKKIKKWNREGNENQEEQCSGVGECPIDAVCFFCERMLFPEDSPENPPVRHHKHYPDYEFEGWAHQNCNLNAKTNPKLVVLMHNLKGYDSHFLIMACAKLQLKYQVDIIATSLEKIFCINIGKHLTILDSLNFFSDSLDNVTKSMNKETDFVLTRQYFDQVLEVSKANTELMLTKGIYPYDYMSSLDKYEETSLPPKDEFYDSLKKKHISDAEYEHAQLVWKQFKVKNMKHYTKLYNIQDVMLLLDATNNLRDKFRKEFKLDPLHHFSLPHLSWNCALKHILATEDNIEDAEMHYITDPTMHVWMEQAKRGGVACGGELKAAEAKNKYIDGVDRGEKSTYIMAYDVNNLYGTALCSYLPTRDFKWLEGDDLQKILANPTKFVLDQNDEQDTGYFFEVDLDFPKEIHNKLKGLTPVPYKRRVGFHELSPVQQQMAQELGMSDNALSAERLITDLYPKRNYVIHYRVLRFYLTLGIVLTKVHRGVSFHQRPILRSYIQRLAKKRQEGNSTFEKNLYKLSANAIYGKSVENVRNRSRFVIVRDRQQALRYNRKPNVASVVFLNTNNNFDVAILRMKKVSVRLDKPLYLGIATLDQSKMILYDWFYNHAMPKYNADPLRPRLTTLGTDTDSVYCLIETGDVYEDMMKDKHMFDMSDYDKNCPVFGRFHNPDNHKKLGVMKDENAGRIVTRYVYLRPKMYLYKIVYAHGTSQAGIESLVSKGKGIDRNQLAIHGTEAAYLECLENGVQRSVTSTTIRSIHHEVFTMNIRKKFVSGFSMKRYTLPDFISSLPLGHDDITHEDNAMKVEVVETSNNVLCTHENSDLHNDLSYIDDYDPTDIVN